MRKPWAAVAAAVMTVGLGMASGAGAATHGSGAARLPTTIAPRPRHVTYGPTVQVVATNANLHQKLTALPSLRFSNVPPPASDQLITIDPRQRMQRFRGAGGALTDSSAWLIGTQLRPGTRAWLLRHLFGRQGISLSFIRLPIGATDFTASRVSYSYDDVHYGQTDPTLSHFSIAHDEAYTIPVLRQILAIAHDPFILASPWSPPGWMKSNDALANFGDGGSLLPDDYGVYAQYLVRYLQAYAQQGITIPAITPQNEPGQQSTYPGLAMTATEEAAFVSGDLTPALHAAGLDPLIFGNDGVWSAAAHFGGYLIHSPAAPDLSGIANHCYFGSPTAMATLHRLDPRLEELETECTPGRLNFAIPEMEIASLREWATGLQLWNLALDPHGGPVQAPNLGCTGCRGIVTIDPQTGAVTFGRPYYELGQITRFVAPGAVRIGSNTFVSYAYPFLGANIASPGLDDVAFHNPDGSDVLVTYNNGAHAVTFAVSAGGRWVTERLPAGTMTTLRWRPARTPAA